MLTQPGGVVFRMLSALALALGLMLVPVGRAEAKNCGVIVVDGDLTHVECSPGDTQTGGAPSGGGGGSSEPSCDLEQTTFNEFCEGTAACWGNNPAANDEEDVADELGEKPDDPEAHVAYKECRRSDGSTYDAWYWATAGDGVTLAELAQRAYGELQIPAFRPTFNPPTRTIVNLDTWWWADGATAADLVGSAALGVRALATPDHMEVDPGDGSGVFNCDFSTAKSDACTYVYRRASNRGTAEASDGSPAYPARMRLVYDVRFEVNGDPIAVAGLPAAFSSTWSNVAVPVREVQTVVKPNADSH